jgi:RNA polymerase sigma-70 factor (ECF subfamily)
LAAGIAAPIDSAFEAAIAGDGAALQRVWQENRRWVAAILLAHKPRWADLEDLLQEVAMSLVRKVGEVRDPRALKPWLRTVAMNAAHAAARSGRKRAKDQALDSEIEQPFVRASMAGPAEVSEREEGRRLLELASQLPDGYREPLLLKAAELELQGNRGNIGPAGDDGGDEDCPGAEAAAGVGDGEGREWAEAMSLF